MKKNFKYIFSFAVAAMAMGFVACDEDDDYVPAPKESGDQVYFSNETATTIALPAQGNTYGIPVCRVRAEEAADVVVNVTSKQNLFQFAKSVKFAAGEKKANLELQYDVEKVGFNKYDTVTVAIADSALMTMYGFSNMTLVIGIPAPWTTIGKATFTENFWAGKSYVVDLQQNDVDPATYRLVKPFGDKSAYANYGADYFEFRLYKKGETLANQVLTQDIVYYDDTPMAYNANYDDVIYVCHPSGGFKATADQSTWVYNCVKSYQEDGTPAVVQVAPFYYMFNNGGWNYSAKEDYFTIVFPGVVILDLSSEVEYRGMFTDTERNTFAEAEVTLGDDVAKAAVAITRGDDVEGLVEAVLAGEVEAIEITESGKVMLPMPCDSLAMYSIVVIPFDEDGNAALKEVSSTDFRIYRPKCEGPWDLSTPKVGDYYYDSWYEGNDEGYILVPVSTVEDTTCFMIPGLAGECDFLFYKDNNDSVWFDKQLYVDATDYGYGKLYIEGYEEYPSLYDTATGTFSFNFKLVSSIYGELGEFTETFIITGNFNLGIEGLTTQAPMYRGPKASYRYKSDRFSLSKKMFREGFEKFIR